MIFINLIIYLLLIITGTGVILTRNPLKQTIVLSLFGLIASLLFLILQAPEVALSEIVVGMVIIPLMVLLSLIKIKSYKEINKDEGE
ncbi:DUF4040 domain-containing protein [Legionella cincinnatiensis]|uniref:Monovalent cation/H+ antiporter subunit B n=1 Tax=Legionella cincinnatiensis TaxID=28085 RepID=A0A378IIB0_9GAMM|nr:DUF4040 domain-containing protein [Legionella cincinnatiensis]KTC92627.1 putative monovalent cation/H+ antiporter subunit B [Legionella cincinnatiensis]STX34241.1 putative monovalent cation/H+ antiporter subunit B [Legionella cincinnatiensis]